MSDVVQTRLENGMRLVYRHFEGAKNYAFGIGFPIGSFHDPEGKLGLAHYHEHMAIKDTARQTAEEIKNEVRDIGGTLNASTGINSTLYRISGREDEILGYDAFARGVDILEDCLENALFTPTRLALEKAAIEGEYGENTSARYEVSRKAYQIAYPSVENLEDSKVHVILGSIESLNRITRDDIIAHEKLYTGNTAILFYYGGRSLDDVKKELEGRFKKLRARPPVKIEKRMPVYPKKASEVIRQEAPESEDVTVWLSYKGYSPVEIPNYTVGYAGHLLQTKALQNLRGRHGLVYGCTASNKANLASFDISFRTGADRVNEVLKFLKETLGEVKKNPPTQREIRWAIIESRYDFEEEENNHRKIENLEEDFTALMQTGQILSVAERAKRISKISEKGILGVYNRVFKTPPMAAIYGKGVDKVMSYGQILRTLGYSQKSQKTNTRDER